MEEITNEAGQLETELGTPPNTDEGATIEDSPTSKEASVEDPSTSKEKPAPYDSDPKWKAARAAEARLESLIEKHDLDDADDIEDALEEMAELRKTLEGKDLAQLIKDQKELKKLQAKMEKEEPDEDETLDETVERLKRENSDLKGKHTKAENERKAREAAKREFEIFNAEIDKVLDNEEVPKEHRDVLKTFLGVDNPVDNVDAGNKREVRRAAKEGVKKFNDFVSSLKQKTIDDYAAGKSKLKVTTAKADDSKPIVKTDEQKAQTSDEFFSQARKNLLEMHRQFNAEA